MQASRTWQPPSGTLGRILEKTRGRLAAAGGRASRPGARVEEARSSGALGRALRKDSVAIIAELKRRSPSKGTLNNDLDANQSLLFERGGAAAISVLTEPDFFGGSLDDLVAVSLAVRLPLLRKDFHIDESQLVEARAAHASAVLLIARALPPDDLPRMVAAAGHLGLEAVVEVRTEDELQRAMEAGAEIIGVNSRDLESLEVDETVPERLIPLVPPHLIAIWESGIETVEQVRRAAASGADAVLVGSALSRSADPAVFVRELSGVERRNRNG